MSDAIPTDKPKRKPRKAAARKKAPGKTAAMQTAGLQREGGEGKPAAADPTTLIRVPMPVRWRDLDAFNHVNNSKYLSFLEEARLQWMMEVPGQGLDEHVAPVVAAAHLNYRRPITWPAQIAIELFVERLGNTSLTVGHRIVDAADPATLYCDGNVVMVWIDRDSGAAATLPEAVRTACSPGA
ncbi:acyl-CoA thioester hydrolase [Lysobacter spongiicola DSM 21749]|uniref:Acyl-CoA thioester hydrolase n=2 Tax=Novilysobacter TaxID=3382699 RepID=A0A1T4MUY8_9GAMM|nr:acyl-CoA thioester hydrolase [Lysobacter spongiicola DSM 21749]